MARLTVDDLKKIKEKHQSMLTLREGGFRAKINVHMGTCGIAAGSRKVMDAIIDEIAKSGANDIVVTTSGCAGLCSKEPMATIEMMNEPPVKYVHLNEDKIRKIFQEHVLCGKIVEADALVMGSETAY